MNPGQEIRFIKPSRYNDWQKNDFGTIKTVLALRPQNQFDVYTVSVRGREVWATHEDIEKFDQLRLF